MTTEIEQVVDQVIRATDATPAKSYRIAGGAATMRTEAAPDKSDGNEDCAALVPFGEHSGVLAVADGLGGLPAARNASHTLINTLSAVVKKAQRDNRPLRGAVLDAIETANAKLLAEGLGNATTAALIEIDGTTIRPYHVGDSQILITGQRGRIKLQTLAHSPTGYAVESGMLDEDDALEHEERHFVANVVGDREMRIEIGAPLTMSPRDTLVIASDGLWDNLFVEEVIDTVRTGEITESAENLMRTARSRINEPKDGLPSHPDDVTFVLYRLAG